MTAFKDRTGEKHGMLTLLNRVMKPENKRSFWKCRCRCGNEKIILTSQIIQGKSRSCGCLLKFKNNPNRIKHGQYKSKLNMVWKVMRQRCQNPNDKNFKHYGGRGITVCEEWQEYINFHNWSIQNNYAEGLTLDRKNNDLGYSPDNCRWVTTKIQAYNKRNNTKIRYEGNTYNVYEFSQITGLTEKTIRDRIAMKWTIEKIITTPYIPRR